MTLILTAGIYLRNADLGPGRVSFVPAGNYELEQIGNPYRHPSPWLVIKDTRIGAALDYLKHKQNTKTLPGQLILD